jgi:hypothetical protein
MGLLFLDLLICTPLTQEFRIISDQLILGDKNIQREESTHILYSHDNSRRVAAD